MNVLARKWVNKRATMSELLFSIFAKELWEHSWFKQIALKNEVFAWKNCFLVCFWQFFTAFPPFFAQEQIATVALSSITLRNDSLLLLFTKEWPKQIASIAHYKRSTVSGFLFRSFTRKKQEFQSKSQRANSQPWCPSSRWLHWHRVCEKCVVIDIANTVSAWSTTTPTTCLD